MLTYAITITEADVKVLQELLTERSDEFYDLVGRRDEDDFIYDDCENEDEELEHRIAQLESEIQALEKLCRAIEGLK